MREELQTYIEKVPEVAKAARLEETFWINEKKIPHGEKAITQVNPSQIADARKRLERFAPYLKTVFPELEATEGIIESELREIPGMKALLNNEWGADIKGRLFLKMDSHLPVSGSVKARGGICEVLKHAEDLALESGKLKETDDYSILASQEFRDFFGQYTVQVLSLIHISSELVSFYGSHDTSNKIRKQIAWTENSKEAVWTEIVAEKIKKQKELLKLHGKEEEAELLASYIREIQWNDISNREGHAAKVYFNALFGMDFTRTADTLVNTALNYGYSIILSAFNREVSASGYVTQLGLFHDNMFNPFNLSSDLMEPFRVLVDKTVRTMSFQEFEHKEKMEIVDILNQEVEIGGRKQYVGNAIKIYCKSVFDALDENDSSLIRFYNFEL